MDNSSKSMDSESYWNMVVGPDRSAADVANEFDLTTHDQVAAWVIASEEAAVSAGVHTGTFFAWQRKRAIERISLETSPVCALYILSGRDECRQVFTGIEAECDTYRRSHPCGANQQYQMQRGNDDAVTSY